jgi:hypothetical protein
VIVSTFNGWRRLRSRRNVQSWEMSSQAPSDVSPPALDAYDRSRIAAELKQAQAALDVAHC